MPWESTKVFKTFVLLCFPFYSNQKVEVIRHQTIGVGIYEIPQILLISAQKEIVILKFPKNNLSIIAAIINVIIAARLHPVSLVLEYWVAFVTLYNGVYSKFGHAKSIEEFGTIKNLELCIDPWKLNKKENPVQCWAGFFHKGGEMCVYTSEEKLIKAFQAAKFFFSIAWALTARKRGNEKARATPKVRMM